MGGERISNHSDIPEGPGQPVVDLEDNDGTEEFVEGGQSEFGGEKPWRPEAPSGDLRPPNFFCDVDKRCMKLFCF